MAHTGKFVSVNLNKSYGQPSSASSAAAGHGRGVARHGAHPNSGGGGGMVVLSRPRSSSSSAQKAAQKLSVPPPLNLPSLKKEHERFDPVSAGSAASLGTSAFKSGSGSLVAGWTKPAIRSALQGKDSSVGGTAQLGRSDADQPGGSLYVPSGAPSAASPVHMLPAQGFSEKAVIFKGEDFPSLRATMKQESLSQNHRQKQASSESTEKRMVMPELQAPLDMRPQMRSTRPSAGVFSRLIGSNEPPQKHKEDLPGLLPHITLRHALDWADDERDTGLGIPERDRHCGLSMFDSGQCDAKYGSASPHDFLRRESFSSVTVASNKEIRDDGSRRYPLVKPRDRSSTHDLELDRCKVDARPPNASKEIAQTANYAQSPFRDNARDRIVGNQDSWYSRRDMTPTMNAHKEKGSAEDLGWRAADNTYNRYGEHSSNWNRGNPFQKNNLPKVQLSSGSKGFSSNDPILSFGREKRPSSNTGKPYTEGADFDSRDPFLGGIGDVNVKVLKKKREAQKQDDFHDPVRESFEAELEKILRVQEQERQRVMEERARTVELARREEEERERLARAEEERRRLLEEEAREAAWREEQERLVAARRAEEQRVAREEEKKRIEMEETRRKEAAHQKLLELEARIARRKAEANARDDRHSSSIVPEQLLETLKDRDTSRVAYAGDWEDGEQMVERITSSASFDSNTGRHFNSLPRMHSSWDGNPPYLDRAKNLFYGSAPPHEEQENIYSSSRRDAFGTKRGISKKEFHNGHGVMPGLPSSRGGSGELLQMPDNADHGRAQRWNTSRDGDLFSKNSDFDTELFDNDKFGDAGWGHYSHGSPHSRFPERSFQNSETDRFSSFAKSRHSLRQPRVPPPLSVSSVQRGTFKTAIEYIGSSFLGVEAGYNHTGRNERLILQSGYNNTYPEILRQPVTNVIEENAISVEQKEERDSPKCESQSSLSVSSPPSSAIHFLHDVIDVYGDSPALPTSAEGELTVLSDNEHPVIASEDGISKSLAGISNRVTTSSTVSHVEDDEWASRTNDEVQQQAEYDEEDDGFLEVDEVHEAGDESFDLAQELEDLQSDLQNTTRETEQLILCFNEGVEIKIPSDSELEITSRVGLGTNRLEELVNDCRNDFSEITPDSSSKIRHETEKGLEDLVLDATASKNCPLNVEAPSSSGSCVHDAMVKSMSTMLSSTVVVPRITSTSPKAASQGEVPVQLQFGLFSGPPLIPSPAPAIQIGSIQMPIHLHSQASLLTAMQPSQAPLYRFGQLKCTPPISQSSLPRAPQTMPCLQSPVSTCNMLNQNPSAGLLNQKAPVIASRYDFEDRRICDSAEKSVGLPTLLSDHSKGFLASVQLKAFSNYQKKEVGISRKQRDRSFFMEKKHITTKVSQAEHHSDHDASKKNFRHVQAQLHAESQYSLVNSEGRDESGPKSSRIVSAGRSGRCGYAPRNSGPRFSFPGGEISHTISRAFQRRTRRNIRRTEFRVRQHVEKKQMQVAEVTNHVVQDDNSIGNTERFEISVRNVSKRDATSNKLARTVDEPDNISSDPFTSQAVGTNGKMEKIMGKEAALKSIPSFNRSPGGKLNRQTSGGSEEDANPPLQSGVVRVFEQPGIEVPSDEDDFIQVRSKKKILNDRKLQKDKENKSKLKVTKTPRKLHAASPVNTGTTKAGKVPVSSVGDFANSVSSDAVVTQRRASESSDSLGPSVSLTSNLLAQPIPPIGTPSIKTEANARSSELMSNQTTSVHKISSPARKPVSGMLFDMNKLGSESPHMPLVSWENTLIDQQGLPLSQTQLEEAVKPAHFESHTGSSISLEPNKAITSVVTQEKPFSLSASSMNSLLTREGIQFGPVTSPNSVPPAGQALSGGYGPSRTDIKSHCTMAVDKDKLESCANLDDAEAEAEAAASAVAVAAISNDEIIVSQIGAGSPSYPDAKNFSTTDSTGLSIGGATTNQLNQEVSAQSTGEESLTVALPADLSVDAASLSLWPPLPSPQTSGPMLSQFPGGPPSHFPCFEMNPMLGGRIFPFGGHDESPSTQVQSQRSNGLPSGSLGTWPQCHSGVESFYSPPAGFTGPFVSHAGIPGVQGPPHMVVYNPFAPVSQFGQVGLSFMGTAYIPSGKQPDWKNNSVSSEVAVGESDLASQNVASGKGNSPRMPAPSHHVGPGSPLLPIAPPLTVFDIPPFQAPADIPMQACWPHLAPPIHTVPLPVPLQQQQQHNLESRIVSQFCQNKPLDNPNSKNSFHEPHSSGPSDLNTSFPCPGSAAVQFPDELCLVDQPTSGGASIRSIRPPPSPTTRNNKMPNGPNTSARITAMPNVVESTGPPLKTWEPASSGQSFHSVGHSDQRGRTSQSRISGGEWHRRSVFQGRNPSSGGDKGFNTVKTKQVYVAKPSTSGPATPA